MATCPARSAAGGPHRLRSIDNHGHTLHYVDEEQGPTLLCWADGDVACKQSHRERWQQVRGNRTYHPLHGAGHVWQDDAGEAACPVVRDWWDRTFPVAG